MKNTKHFIGPPIHLSNSYVLQRVQAACIECDECGQHWHYTGFKQHGKAAQITVMGRTFPVRKAVYMAIGRKVKRGFSVTSNCKNPLCCNPGLLKQARAGDILKQSYAQGKRDKLKAAYQLSKMREVKLTDEMAEQIRQDKRPAKKAAPDYGIHPVYFNRVRRADARLPRNMFSGLIQRGQG